MQFVGGCLAKSVRLAVDRQIDATPRILPHEVEAGGRVDNVRLWLLTRSCAGADFGQLVNMLCHNAQFALLDLLEHVSIASRDTAARHNHKDYTCA
jgi:hypothetical protein